jgi:putative heme iron utilization protein
MNSAELRPIRGYNGNVAEAQSPVEMARALMRDHDRAVLCTALAHGDGQPYGSLVATAPDADGSPLLFLSDLSEHSKNLAREPRAALVFATPESDADPLDRPRVTVLGRIVQCDNDDGKLRRYVARHPAAEQYRAFRDFHLYRLEVTRVHLVAGFGVIRWIDAAEVVNRD